MGCKFAVKSVFGYNLQGVVRAVAVYDFIGGLVHVALSWAFALEDNGLKDVPIFGKWGLPILLGLIMPGVRLTSATLLFRLSKSRNARHLRYWVIIQCIIFVGEVAFIPFLWSAPFAFLPEEADLTSGLIVSVKILVITFFLIWTLTPVYFAYCLLLELESCGSLNVTLSKLSDKDVQDLQRDWLKVQKFHSVKVNDFTISIQNLQVDESRPLGCGSFGTVHKAVLLEDFKLRTVAVKSIQNGTDTSYFKTMLEEFVILAYLGSHSNVVGMIGTCPELLAQKKLYLVMEYCALGSLQNYLMCKRSLFVSFVENGGWTGASGYVYANIRPSITVTTLDLLKWSHDISKGMEFLEEKKVIHGDLATRNVLLDDRRVAKISDFGFSKKIYESINVVRNDIKLIPWRWMAIESLTDMEFSSKSDVWSFGCTIWEIFSLAEVPYSGSVYGSEFIENLKNAKLRLEQPPNATHEVYNLISSCWSHSPQDRPKFSRLSLQLGELILKYTSSSSMTIDINEDDANVV